MAIILDRVIKRCGAVTVFEDFSWQAEHGERWLICGPSGAGKTTLLRLILGLEKPDAGTVQTEARLSACFQEDRLCMRLNALTNVAMVQERPDPAALERALCELLPMEALHRPVSSLSGGMARRVALARAMLAPSEAVILDEPFAGLDAENRARALAFVERHLAGRTLLLVSHESISLPNVLEITPCARRGESV